MTEETSTKPICRFSEISGRHFFYANTDSLVPSVAGTGSTKRAALKDARLKLDYQIRLLVRLSEELERIASELESEETKGKP